MAALEWTKVEGANQWSTDDSQPVFYNVVLSDQTGRYTAQAGRRNDDGSIAGLGLGDAETLTDAQLLCQTADDGQPFRAFT